MKTIAIMQPVFLPWLGYFEQMAISDEFVYLDDVQYTKRDWRNRNKIRTNDGWMWLTVPVKHAGLDQLICDVEIDCQNRWPKKFESALRANYGACAFFDEVFPQIADILSQKPTRLVDLTIPLIENIASYLNIETPTVRSSTLNTSSATGQDRVIEICKLRSADHYYVGPAAKAYSDPEVFDQHGVQMVIQDYQHPVYEQRFKGFESHMSVIDLLMNHGQSSRTLLLSSPRPHQFQNKDDL